MPIGTKFGGATCFDESCPVFVSFVSLVSFVAIVSFVHEESLQLRVCWVYPSFGRQKLLRMSDQRTLISCSSCCTQAASGGLLFTSILSMRAMSVSSLFTRTSTMLVVSDPGSDWLVGRSGRKRNGASEGSLAVRN